MLRIYSTIIVFALYACVDNSIVRKYYDTGELKKIETLICSEDSLVKIQEYYRNGQLKKEGYIVRGRYPNGKWREWYLDGELKWEGEYDTGHWLYFRDFDENFVDTIQSITIQFENDVKGSLLVGQQYRFRLIIKGVHPSLYSVYVDGEKETDLLLLETNHEEQYPYLLNIEPYMFEKDEEGSHLYMLVVFASKDGISDPGYSPVLVLTYPVVTGKHQYTKISK